MAQSTTIKSYQVGLGFKWDEESLRRFHEGLEKTHVAVKNFATGMAALAVAVEVAVTRTAKAYEDLFYLSERTGVSASNLKSMGYAFSQIGLSAEQAGQAMSRLARSFKDDPTASNWLKGQIGNFNTLDEALHNAGAKYAELLKLPDSQANRNRISSFRDMMKDYFDVDMLETYSKHIDDYDKRRAEALQRYKRFNLEVDEATGRAKGVMEAQRRVWDNLSVAWDKILTILFPVMERLFEGFADWLEKEGADKITQWAKDLEGWLKKISLKDLHEALDKVIWYAEAIAVIFATKWAIGIVGNIASVVTSLRGVIPAATAAQTAIAGVNATTTSGFLATLLRRGGALLTGLTGAAGLLGVLGLASAVRDPTGKEFKENTPGVAWDFFKSIGKWMSPGRNDDPNNPKAVAPLPPRVGRPDSYTSSPIPAFSSRESNSLLESIYFGFQHWWSGSGSFSPFVALTEEFYHKLSDTLEEVFFGSRRTTEHGETGVPGSGGAAGGAGPGGRERTGGKFGAAGPGREGGGGTGAELGPGGGDSKSGPGEAGEVREKQSKEADKRRLAISSELRAQLAFAGAKTGILAEVFSGGQHAGQGTGSHRHDKGGAADVRLYDAKTGTLLDMRNPEHQKRMAEFTEQAVRAGVTGVGGAPGLQGQADHYMGPSGMHFGGGEAVTWGAGERAATTPAWIRESWARGRKNQATQEEILKALPKATAGSVGSSAPQAGGAPSGSAGSGTTSSLQFPADWKPDPSMLNMPESRQDISHPERNNPGNLRVSATNDWVGKRTPAGAAFEFFQTLDQGIRARAITYASYIKRGVNTIRNIAEASGPATDHNDVPAMIKAYQKVLGGKYGAEGGADLPVDLTPENIRRLTAAGISIEVGGHGNFLPNKIPQSRIDKVLQGMKEGRDFGGGGEATNQMERQIEDRNRTRVAANTRGPAGGGDTNHTYHLYYNGLSDNALGTVTASKDFVDRESTMAARKGQSRVV